MLIGKAADHRAWSGREIMKAALTPFFSLAVAFPIARHYVSALQSSELTKDWQIWFVAGFVSLSSPQRWLVQELQ